MSRGERFALIGAFLLVLLHAGVFALPALGQSLEYRRELLGTQPWRLLTGHFLHINWQHVFVNAAAWVVLARLFAQELSISGHAAVVFAASVAISLVLAWLYPAIAWYRGFSGVLHAIFFAGATAWLTHALQRKQTRNVKALWLPAALLLGGALKVLFEQPGADASTYVDWLGANTVPQAHLIGAACGAVLGVLLGRAAASGARTAARKQRKQS